LASGTITESKQTACDWKNCTSSSLDYVRERVEGGNDSRLEVTDVIVCMLTDAAYAQSSRFNSERLEPIRGQGATAAASAAAAAAATTAATTTTLLLRCDLSLSHL
jgi:hypothetical protein